MSKSLWCLFLVVLCSASESALEWFNGWVRNPAHVVASVRYLRYILLHGGSRRGMVPSMYLRYPLPDPKPAMSQRRQPANPTEFLWCG